MNNVLWKHRPFVRTDLEHAMVRLHPEDAEVVQQEADGLRYRLRMRAREQGRKAMFGKAMSLELVAAIGRYLLREEAAPGRLLGIAQAQRRASRPPS